MKAKKESDCTLLRRLRITETEAEIEIEIEGIETDRETRIHFVLFDTKRL